MTGKIRILLIGPDSSMPGGTTISFKYLKSDLERNQNVEIIVITSSGIRGSGYNAPKKYIQLISKILKSAKDCDVISFHAMPTALPYIGWFLPIVSRFYKKPFIYRAFGGLYYADLPWLGRVIARYMLRSADMVLLQTKELMRKANNEKIYNVNYFPTARPMPQMKMDAVTSCKRFIFIGHLKIAKGLQYLTKAAEKLPDEACVDVYGPWYDLPKETFDGCNKIKYKGVLNSGDVLNTLRNYHALVFPSFMEEEGYSGIILEAYSVGIPVIATKWNALPEIVEDGKTGLLIEPRSDEEILRAMNKLYHDSEYYIKLRNGVLSEREKYSQQQQSENYIHICTNVLMRK